MRDFSVAIAVGAMVLLAWGLRAEQGTTESHGAPSSLLPGIGTHDPRIRVDPDVVPWRAVGKLQAASMNFRASCTATLVGSSASKEWGGSRAGRLSERSFTRFDGGHSLSRCRTIRRCGRPALIEARLRGDQRHKRGAFAYQ
jgi:hypothetical protein